MILVVADMGIRDMCDFQKSNPSDYYNVARGAALVKCFLKELLSRQGLLLVLLQLLDL